MLTVVLYWAIFFAAYCTFIFTLDWLLTTLQRRRTEQQAIQQQLSQIDTDMHRSVQNLADAFLIAQAEIRRQAGQEVSRR